MKKTCKETVKFDVDIVKKTTYHASIMVPKNLTEEEAKAFIKRHKKDVNLCMAFAQTGETTLTCFPQRPNEAFVRGWRVARGTAHYLSAAKKVGDGKYYVVTFLEAERTRQKSFSLVCGYIDLADFQGIFHADRARGWFEDIFVEELKRLSVTEPTPEEVKELKEMGRAVMYIQFNMAKHTVKRIARITCSDNAIPYIESHLDEIEKECQALEKKHSDMFSSTDKEEEAMLKEIGWTKGEDNTFIEGIGNSLFIVAGSRTGLAEDIRSASIDLSLFIPELLKIVSEKYGSFEAFEDNYPREMDRRFRLAELFYISKMPRKCLPIKSPYEVELFKKDLEERAKTCINGEIEKLSKMLKDAK